MSLVPWLQMSKKAPVGNERDPHNFVCPDCALCQRPVPLEISKTDEFGRAVHEECYVLKVSSRLRVFQLPLQTGATREC